MDNNQKFPEQKAPEKNTDNAFVQVGEDGSPQMPTTDTESSPGKSEDTTAPAKDDK